MLLTRKVDTQANKVIFLGKKRSQLKFHYNKVEKTYKERDTEVIRIIYLLQNSRRIYLDSSMKLSFQINQVIWMRECSTSKLKIK